MMKLQLRKIILPKLPKKDKSSINRTYMLGKIIFLKLPISYLSYLDKEKHSQVGWVSQGKIKVRTQTSTNRCFGKIGKIFCLFFILQIFSAYHRCTENKNFSKTVKDYKNIRRHLLYTVLFIMCVSCRSKSNLLTAEDRKDLMLYSEEFLLMSGKKEIVDLRKIEITDSLANDYQENIARETLEELSAEIE